jgi:hypothetical protein
MEPEFTEEGYLRSLASKRRLFAWCFVNVGGRPEQEAWEAAFAFYTYTPPEVEFRWIMFHERAWAWAVQQLFGSDCFQTRPELAQPSAEYEREAQQDAWECHFASAGCV